MPCPFSACNECQLPVNSGPRKVLAKKIKSPLLLSRESATRGQQLHNLAGCGQMKVSLKEELKLEC